MIYVGHLYFLTRETEKERETDRQTDRDSKRNRDTLFFKKIKFSNSILENYNLFNYLN